MLVITISDYVKILTSLLAILSLICALGIPYILPQIWNWKNENESTSVGATATIAVSYK